MTNDDVSVQSTNIRNNIAAIISDVKGTSSASSGDGEKIRFLHPSLMKIILEISSLFDTR